MDIEFPRLADTLVEGTITTWYKRTGQAVRKGEPLFAVETDKVNADVESPNDGILAEILVAEGELAAVGQVVARFGTTAVADAPPTAPGASNGVTHSAMDVASAASAPDGLGSVRRRIAERVQEARAKVVQGACVRIVDLSRVARNGRSWVAYFAKALAEAAAIDAIGIAVEIPGGLVVPVLRNVRTQALNEISAAIADLAARARDGKLTPADVGGAQFSITNVGGGGTLFAFPLVIAGEPGILAPGAILEGRCFLTLCYDRAAYDEYAADQLLAGIERALHALEAV